MIQANLSAISRNELNEVIEWFSCNSAIIPPRIRSLIERMIAVYASFGESVAQAKRSLTTLRQAMGFMPKSERGRTAALPKASSSAEIRSLEEKCRDLARQKRDYDRELRSLKGTRIVSKQLEFDLGKPGEMLFSSPIAERELEREKRAVNRMEEFGKTTSLHVSHDRPKRMAFKMVATEITYEVETVTDPETGKSVRASMLEDGPEGWSLTWEAFANLTKMHVGFAVPIHRMALMIGQPEFSTSKICRALQYLATNLVGIYLALADQLSEANVLSGDDTSTKVLELGTEENDQLSHEIDARLSWKHRRADGKGEKKALNVSFLAGKSAPDPRSTIRFFRTHLGSVGNLLTKILESRHPKSGAVIFQGDLSTTNLPTEEISKKVKLLVAGCGAHARRPFWRYRAEDEDFCYFLLRCFLSLSKIEAKIDALGRTRERVLKYRGRYGRMIWEAMRNRCVLSTTGQLIGPATYTKGLMPPIWPPSTELHRAGQYVINHFGELTLYLQYPELDYTNNASERALRVEKCMLASSKFRKTKRGRVTLDVLRTINATCTAAGVDLTAYLRFVFTRPKELAEHPENLTPFAFAQFLDKQKNAENAAPATMPSA